MTLDHLLHRGRHGQSDVEEPACLHGLLAHALLVDHGYRHVDLPRIDPTIDDRPAHHVAKLRLGAAVALCHGIVLLGAFDRVIGGSF